MTVSLRKIIAIGLILIALALFIRGSDHYGVLSIRVIEGYSMVPRLQTNDVAVFSNLKQPIPGRIILFLRNNEEYVKRIKWARDNQVAIETWTGHISAGIIAPKDIVGVFVFSIPLSKRIVISPPSSKPPFFGPRPRILRPDEAPDSQPMPLMPKRQDDDSTYVYY